MFFQNKKIQLSLQISKRVKTIIVCSMKKLPYRPCLTKGITGKIILIVKIVLDKKYI